MSTEYFASRLAPLASSKAQELYGRAATAESYLVPEQLLEGACECVAKVVAGHAVAQGLSEQAKAQVMALAPLLEVEAQAPLHQLSWPQLLQHPLWLQIRASALAAIVALEFDLALWEENDL